MSEAGPSWGAAFGGAEVDAMRVYDEVLVPRLFKPCAEALLERISLKPGEAVLDVACGPGSVARMAAAEVGSSGQVTGCDLSPAMLTVARSKPPPDGAAPIEYRLAAADALPVAEHQFDAVTCQQGMQFFPDRPAAIAQMRRALRSGGRVAVAVWSTIERSTAMSALADAIQEVAGSDMADRYRSGPWGFSDPDALCALLDSGGFLDARVDEVTFEVTFDGGPEQLISTLVATPIAAAISALPDRAHSELLAALERLTGPGANVGSMTTNIATARCP